VASPRLALQDWLPASLIALVAFGLRAYRLREYTAFQGDQGIDALAARHLVLDGVWAFEGPATSAGGVHLGPLYYYLLALPIAFGGFDPVVSAAMIVVLATLAVVVLYWLLWLWFGRTAAIVGASLYAVSPAAIVAGRSAWNPAPAPLFLLLAVLGLAQTHRTRDARWLVLVGFGLGCLIQFHYFTLGVVLVCLAAALYEAGRAGGYGWAVLGAAVFIGLLAPFAVHEVAAGLPNVQAARTLATSGGAVADSIPRRLYAVLALELVAGFMTTGIEPLAVALTLVLLVGLARPGLLRFARVLLGLLLVVTLLQVVLYRGPIFEHYFVPLAPLLFLIVGAAVAQVRPLVTGIAFAALLVLNVAASPLREPPLEHVDRTEAVARAIHARAGGEPYALWLVSPNDSDAAYRYQLERVGRPPIRPADGPAARLFLVCQDQPCDQSAAGPDWAAAHVNSDTTFFRIRVLELVR
jgi:4-amino-4-deoxy-L-arabinose transferase-like glycosyltransferase